MESHPLAARVQALAPKSSAEEVWGGMEALGEGGRIKVTLLSTKTNAGFGLPQVFRTSVYSIYYMMFIWNDMCICVYTYWQDIVSHYWGSKLFFSSCWESVGAGGRSWLHLSSSCDGGILGKHQCCGAMGHCLSSYKLVLGASSYISSWKGWSHHNFRIFLWNRRLQVRLLGQKSLWAFTVFFKMLPSDGIL